MFETFEVSILSSGFVTSAIKLIFSLEFTFPEVSFAYILSVFNPSENPYVELTKFPEIFSKVMFSVPFISAITESKFKSVAVTFITIEVVLYDFSNVFIVTSGAFSSTGIPNLTVTIA